MTLRNTLIASCRALGIMTPDVAAADIRRASAARLALQTMVEAKRNSPDIVAYRKNRAAQIQRRERVA